MNSYIDSDSIKIHGPFAVQQIRQRLVGRLAAFDAALEHVAAAIEAQTAAVARAVGAARQTDGAVRQGVRAKTPALKEALALLGRFRRHLDAHPAGTVDRRSFFTADGSVNGVGRKHRKVLLALDHIAAELARRGSPVRDAATWRAEIVTAATALRPAVGTTDTARATRRGQTAGVAQARALWLRDYIAAKLVVEGLLRLTDEISLMPTIFHDLAASVARRASRLAPPPAPVPAPAPPAA